jgi:hypothetical protein
MINGKMIYENVQMGDKKVRAVSTDRTHIINNKRLLISIEGYKNINALVYINYFKIISIIFRMKIYIHI